MSLKKAAAKVRKAGHKNSGQDSILAHITPEEAQMLKARGGSGRTDPNTGLPHFDTGESDGVGGFNDGAPGLGDFGGFSANENDNGGFSTGIDGFSDMGAGDVGTMTSDDFGYDASMFADAPESSFLSSIFGKNSKNAALNALGAIGIPGLAASINSMTAPSTGKATGAMGQGLGSMLGGVLGSVAGPIGSMVGSHFGGQAGSSLGNIGAMSAADNATAQAGNAPGMSGGNGQVRDMSGGSGFGKAGTNPGDFFKNFLTSYAGSGLNDLGKSMFGSTPNQQPMASYPDGAPSNSSNLYSMITGQEQPQMSTPWNTMESQAPNMVGSSAGNFSPSGGEYTQPTATTQGFSMPTMGQAGNFVGNNLGSLVTGLYGMYNNRRQQGQIRDQMHSLQSLYAPGSPYAQQLQAKIAANAAARGTRSNVAGREVQLQAALADKNASMAPTLAQMQGGMGTLQNREMMNLLTMAKDTGLLKSLGSLFQSGG